MTTPMQPDSIATPQGSPMRPSEGPWGSTTGIAELFAIHSQFVESVAQTLEQCRAATGLMPAQRSITESIVEFLRRTETNAREARSQVETLGTALDRIKIVALNTGLEGARLGDVAGKALIAVSDELRTLTARGLEILAEQATTIEQVETDRLRMVDLTERLQLQLIELEAVLQAALAAEQANARTVAEFAALLQQSTGVDVETAAQLGRVSEQAKGLVESLGGLSKSEHQAAVRSALLPALEPLLAWLRSFAESKS